MRIKVQKPHKWDARQDSRACVECGKDFAKGDRVLSDIALTIHADCRDSYRKTAATLQMEKNL